jgi:hypothetical protein
VAVGTHSEAADGVGIALHESGLEETNAPEASPTAPTPNLLRLPPAFYRAGLLCTFNI